jgi:hypothetical protein
VCVKHEGSNQSDHAKPILNYMISNKRFIYQDQSIFLGRKKQESTYIYIHTLLEINIDSKNHIPFFFSQTQRSLFSIDILKIALQ